MQIGMEKMFELSGWGKILSLITGLDNMQLTGGGI